MLYLYRAGSMVLLLLVCFVTAWPIGYAAFPAVVKTD